MISFLILFYNFISILIIIWKQWFKSIDNNNSDPTYEIQDDGKNNIVDNSMLYFDKKGKIRSSSNIQCFDDGTLRISNGGQLQFVNKNNHIVSSLRAENFQNATDGSILLYKNNEITIDSNIYCNDRGHFFCKELILDGQFRFSLVQSGLSKGEWLICRYDRQTYQYKIENEIIPDFIYLDNSQKNLSNLFLNDEHYLSLFYFNSTTNRIEAKPSNIKVKSHFYLTDQPRNNPENKWLLIQNKNEELDTIILKKNSLIINDDKNFNSKELLIFSKDKQQQQSSQLDYFQKVESSGLQLSPTLLQKQLPNDGGYLYVNTNNEIESLPNEFITLMKKYFDTNKFLVASQTLKPNNDIYLAIMLPNHSIDIFPYPIIFPPLSFSQELILTLKDNKLQFINPTHYFTSVIPNIQNKNNTYKNKIAVFTGNNGEIQPSNISFDDSFLYGNGGTLYIENNVLKTWDDINKFYLELDPNLLSSYRTTNINNEKFFCLFDPDSNYVVQGPKFNRDKITEIFTRNPTLAFVPLCLESNTMEINLDLSKYRVNDDKLYLPFIDPKNPNQLIPSELFFNPIDQSLHLKNTYINDYLIDLSSLPSFSTSPPLYLCVENKKIIPKPLTIGNLPVPDSLPRDGQVLAVVKDSNNSKLRLEFQDPLLRSRLVPVSVLNKKINYELDKNTYRNVLTFQFPTVSKQYKHALILFHYQFLYEISISIKTHPSQFIHISLECLEDNNWKKEWAVPVTLHSLTSFDPSKKMFISEKMVEQFFFPLIDKDYINFNVNIKYINGTQNGKCFVNVNRDKTQIDLPMDLSLQVLLQV